MVVKKAQKIVGEVLYEKNSRCGRVLGGGFYAHLLILVQTGVVTSKTSILLYFLRHIAIRTDCRYP
jgi:hypothetical protein